MIVESPCIGVCQMKEDQSVCAGCYRTLAEIAAWSRMTEEERTSVVAAARERKAQALPPQTIRRTT